MFLLRESVETGKKPSVAVREASGDRSFGLQEGRNLCKKITDRARASNTGGYDAGMIKDSVAGVLDGLNMHILQIAERDKSAVLNRISLVLDDAFTEISKLK
jgi:hypothetical protein